MRAEREFNRLGDLGDALSKAASAFTSHPPPKDPELWAGYYFSFAAELYDSILKAVFYLPLPMQAQVGPLMDSYRAAIAAQIRGLQTGQGRAADPLFIEYTHKMTAFNLELKKLLLAEVPKRKRRWWRRSAEWLGLLEPPAPGSKPPDVAL